MPEINDFESNDFESVARAMRTKAELAPGTMGLENRDTEQKIVSLTAPGKETSVPFSTFATTMHTLAQGKDKILYHVDSNRRSVYFTAQKSIMNQRASNVKKEIEFTQNLGKALLEKGMVAESNVATEVSFAGIDAQGREFWETAKAKGDLEKCIQSKDISFATRVSYGRQMLNGMANIHSVDRVHGDMKPENCLVYEDGTVRVADFGKGSIVNGDELLAGYQGNTRFGPPEDAKSKSGDTFGMGLCLVRILEEQFLDKNGAPLVVVANDEKKSIAPSASRRGIERFVLEHPACQRTSETSGSGFLGKASDLLCRAYAKKGWNSETLTKEKEVLDKYISTLCKEIKKSKLLSFEKAERLEALLKKMTSMEPDQRGSTKEALAEYEAIFSEISQFQTEIIQSA